MPRRGIGNDPDTLEVGNGAMTATEYRTHFSLWAMLAAPLIAGNDLRGMNVETAEILTNKEVIAVDQDKLGKAGRQIAVDGDKEVWARELSGGAWAVSLFNRGDSEAEVTLKLADLKINGNAKARDLWKHTEVGTLTGEYMAKVAAHGVVMLRVK